MIELLDRNQTDLHRFEPSSRDTLINEQLNPLKLLHLKDVSGRHRGDKRKLCYERSVFIILLSLWYLLSVGRFSCHSEKTVH